jgi:hypothetical protein
MDLTVPVSDPAAHYRRALEVLDIAPDADDGARLELWIHLVPRSSSSATPTA